MQKEVKVYFQIIILIFSIFSVVNLNTQPVSAQSNVCCEKTNQGEFCQFTTSDQCNQNFNAAAISCEQTSYCGVGTCVVESSCIDGATKASCEQQGGKFFSQPSSSISECQRGCCLAGSQCNFETELKCTQRNQALTNSDFDFRSVGSEQECLSLCQEEPQGCCVNFDSCTTTLQSECGVNLNIITGDGFYSNRFCSSLTQCTCESKDHKGCYDEDVYNFDSCGNREDKVEDCNFATGTICSPTTLKCETLDCEDTKDYSDNVHDSRMGGSRKNGESWCVYESGTGDYLDRPGSRHYRVSCINNEEIVEPCRDFREEVCVQDTSNDFTEASCLENNFDSDADIELDSSTTTVPPGNEFWGGRIGNRFVGAMSGQSGLGCRVANRECAILYVKDDKFSDWECQENCECEEQAYVDQMANLCKAQGDCGADYNIVDEFTSGGFKVQGDAPKTVGGGEKQQWLREGVHGGMKLLSDSGIIAALEKPELSNLPQTLQLVGALGSLAVGLAYSGGHLALSTSTTLNAVAAANLNAAIPGASIVQGSALSAAQTGGGFIATAPSGAITQITPLQLTNAGVSAPASSGVVAFSWAAIAAVALVMIASYVLQEDSKVKYVRTTCSTWQAPTGGSNCEECDDFESCSEYKCRSLGRLCRFIPENEGTSRISCINQNPNDVNSPSITPWQENITQGYSINNLFYGFEVLPTINPYQRISIGIKTDEPSLCKVATEPSVSFDSMINFFGERFYEDEHSLTVASLPGTVNKLYVKCQDVAGNSNNRDYLIQYSVKEGPDLTPPRIDSSNPENFATTPFNIERLPFTLFINEPAECKYSSTDFEFDVMDKNFMCDQQPEPSNNNLFSCSTLLDLTVGSNDYFVRCKDTSENKNVESYHLALFRSGTLNISSTEPTGELFFNDLSLTVRTTGGSQNGKAICSFGESNANILFLNSNSNVHTQPLTLDFGDYFYNVFCSDSAGNTVFNNIQFKVTKDINGPRLLNIFKEASDLNLVLNEVATCEYGFVNFNFGSGQIITENSKNQRFSFEEDKLYYINCKDQFGNSMRELRVIP